MANIQSRKSLSKWNFAFEIWRLYLDDQYISRDSSALEQPVVSKLPQRCEQWIMSIEMHGKAPMLIELPAPAISREGRPGCSLPEFWSEPATPMLHKAPRSWTRWAANRDAGQGRAPQTLARDSKPEKVRPGPICSAVYRRIAMQAVPWNTLLNLDVSRPGRQCPEFHSVHHLNVDNFGRGSWLLPQIQCAGNPGDLPVTRSSIFRSCRHFCGSGRACKRSYDPPPPSGACPSGM